MPVDYARSGHLVTITLDRPAKLNAIDPEMLEALAAVWRRYEADEEAWLAILTGRGRAFCAGADMCWFERAVRGEDSLGAFHAATARDPYWSGEIRKPTLVAVNGVALGAGFDLALRADLRVADESASFRMPEVDVGNVMILWENLPYAIAAEMAIGAEISAQRALQIGLLNRLAPRDGALEVARTWAEELLAKPPLVVQAALGMLREIRRHNAAPGAMKLRERSTDLSRQLTRTEDWNEAVAALLGQRKPTYRRS